MRKFVEIAATGATALWLYPARSLVTASCLVALLTPFLTGTAISHGVRRQAAESLQFGADLYVSGHQFGRPAPLPMSVLSQIRGLKGVLSVVPRIVGPIQLGRNEVHAVVVGLPATKVGDAIDCVEGRLFHEGKSQELVVGTELARRLQLKVGDRIPPFYRNSRGERVSEVVGIFRSDLPLWQSRLVLTSLGTASKVFDQEGRVTDILVNCRPGFLAQIGTAIEAIDTALPEGPGLATPIPQMRVVSREEMQAWLPSGALHREGVFNLHFAVAFALGVPVLAITAGFGMTERRREIGILKATGWQTDEVLLRSLAESFLLGAGAALSTATISWIWLRYLNGLGIASVFLPGASGDLSFEVPYGLTPLAMLLCFIVSFVLVFSGTVYATWRAAIVPPSEAMR